ncbi:MAG: solute:Na+ symporter, family [Clostridia bacterium]|nr:solute:Na+ symporter, family [Clostridia bacterium]
MRTGVLIAVIIYEFVVTVGVGLILAMRQRGAREEFLLAGRDMPAPILGITMALTVLGTAHILGLFENAWYLGAASIWFGIAHVLLLTIICLTTGQWARKLEVATAPEFVERIYDQKTRIIVTCVMAAMIWGILTLETQGCGIIIAALTGWKIQHGALLGAVVGILYVLLAGMTQIGWVNLINTIVMYLGVIMAVIVLALHIPGGWGHVETFYASSADKWMLSIMGTPEVLLTFGLGVTCSVAFSQSITQNLMQPALSAKSPDTVKKALLWAAPVNGLFGVFTVAIGMAAKSLPQFAAGGPKMAAPTMIVELLPDWATAWLLAAFLGAVLSTYAMVSLTPATLFVKDIWVPLFKPDASEAYQANMVRVVLVVLALLALIPAASLPPIVASISWLFSWMVPLFWFVIFGLFWKRSVGAILGTLVISWIANCIWSFTSLPAALHMETIPNAYIALLVTFVVGIILQLILPGKPGLFTRAAMDSASPGLKA